MYREPRASPPVFICQCQSCTGLGVKIPPEIDIPAIYDENKPPKAKPCEDCQGVGVIVVVQDNIL